MTDSNDSPQFDIKLGNFVRLKLSKFYSLQKYLFSSIENGKFAAIKSITSQDPLYVKAI